MEKQYANDVHRELCPDDFLVPTFPICVTEAEE